MPLPLSVPLAATFDYLTARTYGAKARLTEELLTSLTEISELQVASTSAFSFKGKDTSLGTIARNLNVGVILEGSVRRSGNTIRITARLINAVTGFTCGRRPMTGMSGMC